MAALERFTFGVGDRFGQQARAQLAAFEQLRAAAGVTIVPVWNKSHREHGFVGTHPRDVESAARAAIHAAGWTHGWHADADHIRLSTVAAFIPHADFFTIDVADSIGQPADEAERSAFIERHPELRQPVVIAGVSQPLALSPTRLDAIVSKYWLAAKEAGAIHRAIADAKGGDDAFIAEVSMDETDAPQTPDELLVILALLAEQKVRARTIAPKFTGRFNKGVDYVGDLAQFRMEFRDDLAVIAHAVSRYDLPSNLKLSIHSGSDKFSLYPIIREEIARAGAGLHLKTAGTTWLEELIGLAESGGAGLNAVQEIYEQALAHVDELCAPYAAVIDIDRARLPAATTTADWSGPRWANAIRHVPGHPEFSSDVRQLLHVSFKLAAKMGQRYLDLLAANADIVGANVTMNLFDRHLKPLFIG